MTEQVPEKTEVEGRKVPKAKPKTKRTSRKGAVAAVASLAAAASLATFGGLWLQMANGNDPVLAGADQKVDAERPTVIRKVIVVRKLVGGGSSSGYSSAGSGYAGTGSYSSSTSGGSVAAAPAPAPVVSQPS